jgi:uncharacterized protein (TIGR02300 family)
VIDAELGKKLVCPSCAVKFYDLAKEPAQCPKCETIFSAEPILPSKEDRPPATEPEAAKEETPKTEAAAPEAEEEVVSLEDLVEGDDIDDDEDDDEMAAIKDVDLGDGDKDDEVANEDDDTFLEIDDNDPSSVSDLVGAKSSEDED